MTLDDETGRGMSSKRSVPTRLCLRGEGQRDARKEDAVTMKTQHQGDSSTKKGEAEPSGEANPTENPTKEPNEETEE